MLDGGNFAWEDYIAKGDEALLCKFSEKDGQRTYYTIKSFFADSCFDTGVDREVLQEGVYRQKLNESNLFVELY
jgi:hypothetical protein